MKTFYNSALLIAVLMIPAFSLNAGQTGYGAFSLLYFSVNMQDDHSVYAEWEANPDVTYSAFVIQHSNDGLQFDTLDVQLVSAAEPAKTKYDFVHSSAPEGMNFYRVIMIDAAGNSYYSAIAEVNIEPEEKNNSFEIVNAFPVPADDELTLTINCLEKSLLQIVIVGAAGKIIDEQTVNGVRGINTIKINCSAMESGNQYTIIVRGDSGKKQYRRIIKR